MSLATHMTFIYVAPYEMTKLHLFNPLKQRLRCNTLVKILLNDFALRD